MQQRLLTGLMVTCLLVGPTMAATPEDLEKKLQRGELSAVAGELDEQLRATPDNEQLLFIKARLLTQQGDVSGATRLYQQLIKQFPSQPEAYNNLAMLQAKQGDLHGAQKTLEQGMRTNPSYAALYDNLSAVYVEQARDAYGKALRLSSQQAALQLRELNQINAVSKSAIVVAANTPRETVKEAPAVKTQPQPAIPVVETKPVVTASNKTSAPATPSTPPVAPIEKQPPPVTTAAVTPKSESPVVVKTANASPDKDTIITTLQGWAAAWSGKSPDLYFSFYDKTFAPPGMERSVWEAQRRDRLASPQWIKVGLTEFNIKPVPGKRAKVRLIQEYQSDTYNDRIRKELVLQQTDDGWRIIAERKIAAIH